MEGPHGQLLRICFLVSGTVCFQNHILVHCLGYLHTQCSPGVVKSHLKADNIIFSKGNLNFPLLKFIPVLFLMLVSTPNNSSALKCSL